MHSLGAIRATPRARTSSCGAMRVALNLNARRRPVFAFQRAYRQSSEGSHHAGPYLQDPCTKLTLRREPLELASIIEQAIETAQPFIEDAAQKAIAKAHQTVRNIHWFTLTETRGHVIDGKVAHWQVSLKVGFTLE